MHAKHESVQAQGYEHDNEILCDAIKDHAGFNHGNEIWIGHTWDCILEHEKVH